MSKEIRQTVLDHVEKLRALYKKLHSNTNYQEDIWWQVQQEIRRPMTV